jgi:hypothetical protein
MNKTIVFSKNGMTIKVEIVHGVIKSIENNSSVRFPFSIGQHYNMSIQNWAELNSWLMDGKDLDGERKIYGIKKKDIPSWHPLKRMR